MHNSDMLSVYNFAIEMIQHAQYFLHVMLQVVCPYDIMFIQEIRNEYTLVNFVRYLNEYTAQQKTGYVMSKNTHVIVACTLKYMFICKHLYTHTCTHTHTMLYIPLYQSTTMHAPPLSNYCIVIIIIISSTMAPYAHSDITSLLICT